MKLLKKVIASADELEIREALSARLAPFGQVEKLRMFEADGQEHGRVIVVTMATSHQAVAAANELGLTSFGDRSLVITA